MAAPVALEVHKLYFVSVKYPKIINDASPAKPQPPPESFGWCSIDAPPSLRIRSYGHVGLLLHYDEVSQLGVIFLGSSNPHQPQRFVAWHGTERKPFQPLRPLEPEPLNTFSGWHGYLNFSHAIKVKVIAENHPIVPSVPGMAIVRDIVRDIGEDEVDQVDSYVLPPEVAYLKSLHNNYWIGMRFSEDGTGVHVRGGGGGGGGGRAGGGGAGGGGVGGGGQRGVIGGVAGHGGGGVMVGGVRSGDGEMGGDAEMDTMVGTQLKTSSGDPERDPDPIDVKTGLRHSVRFKLAMLEQMKRAAQFQLVDGDFSGEGESLICTVSPLTKELMQGVSSDGGNDLFGYIASATFA